MTNADSVQLRDNAFGVYIHWPFCLKKCPYCDFNSHVRAVVDVGAWQDALLADMRHEAELAAGEPLESVFFGGEGLFLAKLTGPGEVWLQSLPFSRLASRIFAAAPQNGGSREEGSVLGGFAGAGILGGILGGDND